MLAAYKAGAKKRTRACRNVHLKMLAFRGLFQAHRNIKGRFRKRAVLANVLSFRVFGLQDCLES